MADTNVNSKLNKNIGDIPKDAPMFSPSVDIDLVNVNITDKIKEIATAIANSTNSQIAHDKHVLSLTIGAVSDEFASLLAEKLNSSKSDKRAKDILPAALLDEGFTLFNSSIFTELNRHTAEHLVELRAKSVAFIDKQVNLTVMSVVAKIISQQTAITNKFADASKNIIKVVTDATSNLSEDHKNTLKYKAFTGHIFQRIALEVADKKKRKAKRKAQLKKEWGGAFTKLITPTTWLDNVKETFSEIGKEFAETYDYIFGAKGNREKRKKLKQAKVDLQANVDLQQQQLKLDAANLRKLSKNVFTTIKTLHDETADILTDLELVAKQNEKDKTYEGRQQLDEPDNTAQNVKASVDVDTSAGNILVALCGVALFATIAVGVYKAWPMIRRVLKLSKQPSLGDAPDFADVEGFEPVPNNDSQQADVADDNVDNLEAALDTDFKEADDKITTAINDAEATLDSDGKQAYTEVIDEINKTSIDTAATLSDVIDDALSDSQHIQLIPQETDTDTTQTVNKQVNTLSTEDMHDTAVEQSDEQDDKKIAPDGLDPSDIATKIIGKDEGLEQIINDIEEQNTEEKINAKLQDDQNAAMLKEDLQLVLNELKTQMRSFEKNIPLRLRIVNEQIDKADTLFVETADALQKQHLELGNVHITTIDPDEYKTGGWLSTHPFRQMADSINSTIKDGSKVFNAHEKQIKILKSLEQRLNAAIDDNMADKPEYLLVNTAELHELHTSIDHLATDIFTPTFNIMINTTIENADKPKRLKETLTRHSATTQTASYSAYN